MMWTKPISALGQTAMKKRKKNQDKVTAVVGVAWYRRDQWPRLLEASADRAMLEDTYDEWLQNAEKTMKSFKARGIRLEKVDVDLEQLLFWCAQRGRPVNAESRTDFTMDKMQRMAERGPQ